MGKGNGGREIDERSIVLHVPGPGDDEWLPRREIEETVALGEWLRAKEPERRVGECVIPTRERNVIPVAPDHRMQVSSSTCSTMQINPTTTRCVARVLSSPLHTVVEFSLNTTTCRQFPDESKSRIVWVMELSDHLGCRRSKRERLIG